MKRTDGNTFTTLSESPGEKWESLGNVRNVRKFFRLDLFDTCILCEEE